MHYSDFNDHEEDSFVDLVDRALHSIPDEFLGKMQNVDIFIADWPSWEQQTKVGIRKNGYLLGLYEGIPQTKRGNSYGIGGVLPDRITIFKYPLMSIAMNPEHLEYLVKDTVMHEIAHHFGMSDEEIYRIQGKTQN